MQHKKLIKNTIKLKIEMYSLTLYGNPCQHYVSPRHSVEAESFLV